MAKVLEFQLQHHSFQGNPRADLLQNGLFGSPCSPRDSQESSPTPQSKASILGRSAFFTVQVSHPYVSTGKTLSLTRRTFVGKVMSLLLNMLSKMSPNSHFNILCIFLYLTLCFLQTSRQSQDTCYHFLLSKDTLSFKLQV